MAEETDIDMICAALLTPLTNHYQKNVKRRQEALKKKALKTFNKFKRNKRKREALLFICMQVVGGREPSERRFWIQTSKTIALFWEETVHSWDDDQLWLDNFRMSRSTFDFLCKEMFVRLQRQDTNFRKAITVEKRVAICIWHLATGEDLRSLAWRFGVGKSTVCEIVHDVCDAVVDILLPRIIKWPTGEKLHSVIDGFLATWSYPQCAGAIDGTHIPIVAPSESSSDFFNRKGFYSIVLQVVVDHQYRFTDVYIKWPGKVHDARILANSRLFMKGQAGLLFPDLMKNIGGYNVPVMLIGDPAYPLLPWLMKRYPNNGNLSPEQITFNYRLSRARMVVECALGRMKNRFRCLLNKSETSLDYLPAKVATCCVLHNICEMRADLLAEDQFEHVVTSDDENVNVAIEMDTNAEQTRHALTEFFKNN